MAAYYNDAATWQNALVINTEKGSNHNANIYLMEDPENTGNANVQGAVTEENTKITKSSEEVTGEPVKGVSVILKGKKKANADMYDLVRTNGQGVYEFKNVNTGTYEIVCDYPGMEQTELYEIEVSEDKESYENYDYVMQGDTIFIAESDTATNAENISENNAKQITVYPNPASSYIYVQTEGNLDIQKVSLHSLNGKIVYSEANTGNMKRSRLNIEKFEQGIYFLRIQTTSEEIVRRLIVQ
jgi:5-hydroxyisourate hydrolase-like protein (transthyretin family)